MVRVPTYASYMGLMNQTMKNKAQMDLYNYQAVTGLKSPTYSGYGMSAYSIVNLEASLSVTENFIENNKILSVELKTMNTAMQSVNSAVSDVKSMLNSFSGMDVSKLSPDYTGGEISFTSNNDVYQGRTITIEGTQYTFANDGNGNNIDLSGLTPGDADYGEQVMSALKDKVGATNPDFKFEGNKFTFPLYTINGSSSVLNADGVETGTPHTMSGDQSKSLKQLQTLAFSTMKMLTDSLNVSANGKYLFGGGNSSESPVNFPFTSLEEFQKYYDGLNISYPTSATANLATRDVGPENTGDLTLESTGGNTGKITAEKDGGFLQEMLTANESTTGSLTFNSAKGTINATQYGAFNTLKAGDTLVIGDAGNSHNGAYIIKSVSEDGKTITVEESTPIRADDQIVDGGGATFSTSYPIGSVINMGGFGNNISPQVQVTGISPDGTELYVTVDPSRWPSAPTTFTEADQWSMKAESYYQGGSLVSEKRISENQSIVQDITANNPAFEKLFRALGQIAQGNLVDTRNPADDFDGLIDSEHAADIIDQAVQMLQDAINSNGINQKGNADLDTVTAKLSSNMVVLNSNDENLTLVKTNLENSVTSLKEVDKTEATIKALMALNNLNASYQVLQGALNTSLLNYLK